MRLLHTADWHLGKQLYGQSLLEDQSQVLEQLIDLACEQQPDAILLAGDVFDRAIAPVSAVELYDEVLCSL